MAPHCGITAEELLGLVAGTLNHEDFARVAKAVKNDPALQVQLAGFELIRSGLLPTIVFDRRESTVEIFAEDLLRRVGSPNPESTKIKTRNTWISRLGYFFTVSSNPARFAYGLVAIQAVGIVWLIGGALQTIDGSLGTSRTAEPDSKQLGVALAYATFSVSFDPATPESTVRGLLLELEAQIIAGPSQLGQYKIVVARNRSHLALLKLREAVFVEQVTEIAKEAEKPDLKDGDKK